MSDVSIREMNESDLVQVQKLMDQLNEIFETKHVISIDIIDNTFKTMNDQKNFYLNYTPLFRVCLVFKMQVSNNSLWHNEFQTHYNWKYRQYGILSVYVAVMDGKITGFISSVIYKTFFHPKGTFLINELVVEREYRGKSIGEKLLQKTIEFASENNLNEIEAGTAFDNKAAIAFYRKNGLVDESILLGKELNE